MSALLTESPTQRLERLLPGSAVRQTTSRELTGRFVVEGWRDIDGKKHLKELAIGSSEREAIDRALVLFGAQR